LQSVWNEPAWYRDLKKSKQLCHGNPRFFAGPGSWYQIIAFYQIAGMINAGFRAPRSLKHQALPLTAPRGEGIFLRQPDFKVT